jgi:hypothetical protein
MLLRSALRRLPLFHAPLLLLLLIHSPLASSHPNPDAFIAWAHSVGLDSSNITLQSPTILAGWGVRASRPILKGQIFM